MLGIFEFNEDRKKDSLLILVSGEQNSRDFIQVPSLAILLWLSSIFVLTIRHHLLCRAPDDGRFAVSSPCLGFLSKFDPLFCDLKGHRSEFCPE